jgi:hypothetical protein
MLSYLGRRPGEYRIAIVDDRLRVSADVDLRGAKELV